MYCVFVRFKNYAEVYIYTHTAGSCAGFVSIAAVRVALPYSAKGVGSATGAAATSASSLALFLVWKIFPLSNSLLLLILIN